MNLELLRYRWGEYQGDCCLGRTKEWTGEFESLKCSFENEGLLTDHVISLTFINEENLYKNELLHMICCTWNDKILFWFQYFCVVSMSVLLSLDDIVNMKWQQSFLILVFVWYLCLGIFRSLYWMLISVWWSRTYKLTREPSPVWRPSLTLMIQDSRSWRPTPPWSPGGRKSPSKCGQSRSNLVTQGTKSSWSN